MSLTVPADVLTRAENGDVDDATFVAVVRESLPYAYDMVSTLSARLARGDTADGMPFADNREEPSEVERGQLLRAMASDSIRSALQRHFGVRLAFQNCHRAAAFPLDPAADEALARFTSTRAQLLNQSPTLVSC